MTASRAVLATIGAMLMFGLTVGQAAATEAPADAGVHADEGLPTACIIGLGNDGN
ncbi:hypothetical protein [Lentzea aerocolonigenes]|uniref:hypothetical protein n=1 Tax=Lentzea aerocolonigenes TaxID=68170 RepID=UPI000A7C125B|nr:hypothetical protein [Lentzea aerocolonigenes]